MESFGVSTNNGIDPPGVLSHDSCWPVPDLVRLEATVVQWSRGRHGGVAD